MQNALDFRTARALRAALVALAFLFALAAQAFAQGGPTGAITGTVRDPGGAAVAGASIEVVNQTTGVSERTVTTNGEGQFTVTALPVGAYRLVVTASGFSKAEAPDIKVNVTETTSVQIPLQVGRVEESVTVTDTATALQLSNPTTGQTLQAQTVGQLPLSTRNFLTLLTLSPGANTELFQSDALGAAAP